MRRIIYLTILFFSLSLLSAQPPLTTFKDCVQSSDLSILDYIKEHPGTNSSLSDTSIFCMLGEYLKDKETQEIDLVIDFVHRQATKYLKTGFFTISKEYRTIQAHLAVRINNDSIYMEALYQIALSSYRMGDVLDAARYNMEGKVIAIRDSQHMRHISFFYRESWIYWRMLRNEKAIESMEECKALAAIHSPNEGYLFSYHNGLGNFHLSLENYKLARFHQDSAIFYADKLCFTRAKAITKSDRAIAYAFGDTTDLAFRFSLINEALKVHRKQEDRENIAANFNHLGFHNLLAKDYGKALEMFDSVHYYTDITKDRVRELQAFQGKSLAYEGQSEFEKALEFEKRQFDLHKELYGASTMSDVFDLEQAVIEKEADFELEKITLENDVKTLKISRQKNNILILFLGTLVASLLIIFWFNRKKQKQEIENLLLKQKSQNRIIALEKKALQSQMNPHFIFNSLNSIKSYIANNEARTATRFLNKFSQLMRIILANSSSQLVGLSEELNTLKLYIELEQFRLNKSFDFEIINRISISQSQKIQLPPLIIQPYVENAIWHGLVPKEGSKKLKIEVFAQENTLKIYVRDNGIGRSKSATLQASRTDVYKSMGMKITNERIKLHNDDSNHIFTKILDLVDAEGNGIGTEIQLSLPIKTQENE